MDGPYGDEMNDAISLLCDLRVEDVTPEKRDLSDYDSAINDDRPIDTDLI